MGALIVFAGQTYGRLTVIRRMPDKTRGRPLFECRCKCGTIKEVLSQCLGSGNTRSCGCLQREISKRWAPEMCRSYRQKAPGLSAKRGAFCSTRQSARKRGLLFEISFDQFVALAEQPCAYCGGGQSNLYKTITGAWKWNGLDRVDSKDGYIVGNVVPCCKWCNQAKSGRTKQEFLRWIRAVHNKSCNQLTK